MEGRSGDHVGLLRLKNRGDLSCINKGSEVETEGPSKQQVIDLYFLQLLGRMKLLFAVTVVPPFSKEKEWTNPNEMPRSKALTASYPSN